MKSTITRPIIKIKNRNGEKIYNNYKEINTFILEKIKNSTENFNLVIETYPVTNEELLLERIIKPLHPDNIINSVDYFEGSEIITKRAHNNITNDRIFGLMSHFKLEDFLNLTRLEEINKKTSRGFNIIYGPGSSLIKRIDSVIYVDLARWEIQKRYRTGKYSNWQADNAGEDPLKMIKRGYFFEWRIADRFKRDIQSRIDYYLDIHREDTPVLISKKLYNSSIEQVITQPFSLVPFFDPGVWGGTWMQETFGVGRDEKNLAWSFNGVPEENSVMFDIDGNFFEIPANNVVFGKPVELLGNRVYGLFGYEFPIRFNFLDTMNGQNLSLQVHPKISYAQENFGANYTQDESYYVLECKNNAVVYLGVQNGVEKKELIDELRLAEKGIKSFEDEKYIYSHPMTKHDHYLIPSGTIHSSGKDSVILEISATPNRFTFKLWDWGRVDFDGLPRPVNIDHGERNIDIYKDQDWVQRELINKFEIVAKGNGWVEEKTGLHETEFIETRRHTFTKTVLHRNNGSVNVLNLVEGKEAVVTSPTNQFDPFFVEYAQTFIIPATVKEYEIAPCGKSMGKELKTIKAYIR